MGSQDLRKDMNVLVKMIRKLGNKMCDKGTYKEREGKHPPKLPWHLKLNPTRVLVKDFASLGCLWSQSLHLVE